MEALMFALVGKVLAIIIVVFVLAVIGAISLVRKVL
jgi:hypothetical protein